MAVMAMVRTQIQLTPEQVEIVKRVAAARSISMAEVIRQCIDRLETPDDEAELEERWRRAMSVMGIAKGGPDDVSINHDKYLAEAFEQ